MNDVNPDELKRAEREVKIGRDYAEAILRAAPVPFLVLGPDLRVETASEGFYKVFQVGPDETKGRLVYEIGNGQWRIPELRQLLEDVIPQHSFFNNFEVTHEFENIGRRTMLLNARRTDSAEGMPEHILLAIEDITARKAMEESLRANGETFFNLIENAPFGVYVVDSDFRLLQVSAGSQKAFQNVRPLLGRDFAEAMRILWPEPFASEVIAHFRHTLATGERYLAPPLTEHRADVDAVESYDWKIERVALPDGQWGVVCYFYDTTEQKQIEEALRASTAQFRFVTDHVPVLIVQCDAQARYTFVNAPYASRFNLRPEDLQGRTIPEVIGPAAYESIRRHVEAALRGEPADFEERIPYEHGARWMHCSYVPDRAPDGEVRGFVAVIQEVTARKESEEALRESNERTANIVESITDAFVTLDKEWRFTYLNDRAMEIMGPLKKSRAQLLGKNHWEEFPDLVGTVVEENYRRAMDKKTTAEFELYYPPLDAWFELRVYPSKEGISLYYQDVTVRKLAVAALHESESRKSAILDGALDGIITMDHEGRVVDFNPAAEAMFGLGRADIVGQRMAEKIIPERLRARHYQGLAHYLQTGEGPVLKQRIEVPALHADGHEFTIELSINRIADIEPPMFTATLRDITARRQGEAALRESEERFRNLSDNIPQLAWIADPGTEGKVLWFNKSWLDYTGTTIEEMAGSGWQKVHHPGHAARVIEKFARHVREKLDWEDTFPLRRADGEFRWFLSRMKCIRNEAGEVVRIFGTNTDITEQREAADALARAKEQAEAAARAKDEFLAALSHELRTPLTPVLMMAGALEADPALSPELREQLAMMRRNIELEARLIDDLLDLTRITRGKLQIAPVVTDMHELLKQTAEIVRSEGLGKQVRMDFKLEAGRHHVLADPTRLQQVFWNVFKNALKFTAPGGSVTVSTRDAAAHWISVSVTDNGVGISAAALPHIFKAFEQGDITGQHRYGGLGLGLAISQAIVEVHGGTISAASEGPSLGATFTVALATVAAPTAASPAEVRRTAPDRALRLLIVEDHETTRTVLARLLTRHGHQVITAGSAQEALAVFAAERFDAVISDLGLPDGTGLDLMREMQRQRPVPGIALSGYGMEEDLRQAKEAGFFAHLVKPVNLGQLYQLLDQITPAPR